MKRHIRLLIFPILVLIAIFGLSFFKVSGSSVGIYNNILAQSTKDDNALLFGSPRYIRGDQFLVALPMIISQDINKEWRVNHDMAEGTNLGLQSFPSKNFFAIFKPSAFAYFFSNNTDFSYSFQWWAEFGLLLLGTYLLLLELTNKNLLISILGSLTFLFTPFVQWWNQILIIAWISFGLFFFLRLIKEKDIKIALLYGLGLLYSIIAFIVLLYPPFQISVAYVALFIATGYIFAHLKNFKENQKKIVIPIITGVLFVAGIIVFLYTKEFENIIEITTKTVYPGSRFIKAGGGNFTHLFDGFYNILLQKDSNIAPFANQSESSNFLMLFPPIVLWVLYKNIFLYIKKRRLDWIGLSIVFVIIIFSCFYFLKIPDIFSKYSLFYLIPPARLILGFGYASYLLMFYTLSKDIYIPNKNLFELFFILLLSLSFSLIIYIIGLNLFKISPSFFNFPNLLNHQFKILLSSALAGTLIFSLLKGYTKIFVFLVLTFSLVSTIYINPLYKGLDVLTKTDVAQYIKEKSEEDDSKWIAYNNNYLAQYALSNNASIINGIHMYPQFKIWAILDPEKKYTDIYNRYAHINVSEYEDGEEYIKLLYPDALQINISPCDSRWKALNAKYIITDKQMSEYECLTLLKNFDVKNVYIYEIK